MRRTTPTPTQQHGKLSANQKLVLAFLAAIVTLAFLYAAYQLALHGQGVAAAAATIVAGVIAGRGGLFSLFKELGR